jgi:chromosome segregation ATPase
MGPTLEEISAKADELQTALDAEQQQVATLLAEKDATIATLGETITDLQTQIADGGTAEQRQAVLDKLNALKADLESTVAPSAGSDDAPEETVEG